MVRRRRRRKKSKSTDNGGSKKVEISYPEDVIIAVKYLMEKGITRSTEIAERLDLSPYTVRNIKRILRKRGLIDAEEQKVSKKAIVVKAKSKKPKDVIEEILGGGN